MESHGFEHLPSPIQNIAEMLVSHYLGYAYMQYIS